MKVNEQTNLKSKAHLYVTLHKTEILAGDITALSLSSLLDLKERFFEAK